MHLIHNWKLSITPKTHSTRSGRSLAGNVHFTHRILRAAALSCVVERQAIATSSSTTMRRRRRTRAPLGRSTVRSASQRNTQPRAALLHCLTLRHSQHSTTSAQRINMNVLAGERSLSLRLLHPPASSGLCRYMRVLWPLAPVPRYGRRTAVAAGAYGRLYCQLHDWLRCWLPCWLHRWQSAHCLVGAFRALCNLHLSL